MSKAKFERNRPHPRAEWVNPPVPTLAAPQSESPWLALGTTKPCQVGAIGTQRRGHRSHWQAC